MPSVTRGNSQHRAKRAAAATRILDATERLLNAGERFTEIPVERLLSEADVSRSTFYVHFADKSALLSALASSTIAELNASGLAWWNGTHALGTEAAAETIRDLIRLYRAHGPLIRTIAEVAAYDDGVRDLWRTARESYAGRVADGIRAEQTAGFVPVGLDVTRTSSYVTMLVDAAILDHVVHGSPGHDDAVAAALARMGWLAYYGTLAED